ncbi:MAG: hypothetical protein RL033_5927 [Pseudomonadota bacterium]|jgi:hypothetical protein
MSPPRAVPSLALAAYAETWISGAKVIVLGDALSPLAERLVERGARLVQVYDRDPTRVAEASALNRSRQISFAALDGAGSAARDGVFDFGIVEDLGALPRGAEPLVALQRALGRRGMALIAARNPEVSRSLMPVTSRAPDSSGAEEPLGYYELFELVGQHFEEVRMLGQTAFVGYAVADFAAAEDSDVRLDTAFLPGGAEEPEWFLALVSTLPVSSEAFSVIQLPLADLPLPAAPADRQELERLEQALERAEARVVELERAEARVAELERTRSAQEPARDAQATRLQRLEDTHRRELEALKAELNKREQWLSALESRAATADQRADDASAELDQLTQRESQAAGQRKQIERQLEEALRAKRALEDAQLALKRQLDELEKGSGATARNFSELERRALTLSTQLDELRAQLGGAERERAELRTQLSAAERQAATLRETNQEESAGELRELEGQLVERGTEVARLERELQQTERFGRQLIAQLQTAKATTAAEGGGQRELERLARRNAELEADLEAARWTISSLGASSLGASSLGADRLGVPNEAVSKAAGAAAPPWHDGTNEKAHRSAD